MIVFLTLCYCAVLFLLTKLNVIKLNTFWKASPLLWMALLLLFLFVPMQWGAPSGPTRNYETVIEIVPNVSGEVVSVPIKPREQLAKGAVLFEIDLVPFQAVVDQKKAALAEAQQAVPQLKAILDAKIATVAGEKADRDKAKDGYERYRKANLSGKRQGGSGPFSDREVEQRRLTYLASVSQYERAKADAEQARLAYRTQINGVNTTVARLQADLRKAEYNLAETKVRAPADGYVLGLTLRPGQRVAALPLRSWIAFVPTEGQTVVAAIPQSRLRHVKVGQDAEVTFAYMPGKIIPAKVSGIANINKSAQLPPNGVLPSLASHYSQNEAMAVWLKLEAPQPALNLLPGGADGTAAIYTESAGATHVIRKVMIRMDAWMNYVVPN